MSSQSLSRARKPVSPAKKRNASAATRRKASRGQDWLIWWPLLAGIAVTVAAVKVAEILPLMGPGGLLKLQLLYPYAMLLKQPRLGLAEQTSDSWSQLMLYAQWVLYGLYASLAIRWTTRWRSFLQIGLIHFAGFAALWLLGSH